MATAGGYSRMQLLGHGYGLYVVDGNDNDNVPQSNALYSTYLLAIYFQAINSSTLTTGNENTKVILKITREVNERKIFLKKKKKNSKKVLFEKNNKKSII